MALDLQYPSALPCSWSARRKSRPTVCRRAYEGRVVAFKNFGDGLLDYMEAGPKLRKWYGEGERRSKDGRRPEPEDEEKVDGPADSILVPDADSPTGELILLQLILARLKVTALVRNSVATQQAYGDYVRPIQGRVGDKGILVNALSNAKAVICTGPTGALPETLPRSKVRHVVLLSTVGSSQPGVLGKLLGGDQAALADPSREEALNAADVPLTTVRVGRIVDVPGGSAELNFSQGNSAGQGDISREDVAQTLVRALQKPPRASLAFAVSSKRTGQRTQWERLFADLREAAIAQP